MSMTIQQIVARALEFKPIAIFAGFSGGNDSLAVTDWMMRNVPGCRPVHFNTGIGIERSRIFVRETSKRRGWDLLEIRAKEDCGQDYDEICLRYGFPGPESHQMMYRRLKERCVEKLVRDAKVGHPRIAKVLIATGIRHDESIIRMGYAGREVNAKGAQLWVNPIYWWSKAERDRYIAMEALEQNPIAQQLGMSGECGCGAYAHPGEFARWKTVDPEFGRRIEALQERMLERGFTCNWEGRPPRGGFNPNQQTLFHPLCVGCEKSAIVQAEMDATGGYGSNGSRSRSR